jgi:hypothetical protein
MFHITGVRPHGTVRPPVADGGYDVQIWRVAVNISNKQSPTADKVWSTSLRVGRGVNISLTYRNSSLLNATQGER